MKISSLKIVLLALLLTAASVRCSTGAKLLNAGSPLMSALSAVPGLSNITDLLKTPGLGNVLGDVLKKPFTLLAPTNEAFNSLGASALSALSNPSNINQLVSLLKDHIIPGKLDASSLMQSGLKAVSGKALDLGSASLGNLISDKKFNVLPINKILGSI